MNPPPTPPKRPTSSQTSRPSSMLAPREKPVGTRSLVEQIIAEQKQQKSELKTAMERKESRFRLAPLMAGILLVANVVAWLVIPPSHDSKGDRRNTMEIDRDLRLIISSAANEVDIYKRLHDGKMPAKLSDAGVTDSLTLINVDGTVYEIRGTDRGVSLAYRSNMPITDFMDAAIPLKK